MTLQKSLTGALAAATILAGTAPVLHASEDNFEFKFYTYELATPEGVRAVACGL